MYIHRMKTIDCALISQNNFKSLVTDRFPFRFALVCIIFLLSALYLEVYLRPFNLLTARLSRDLISLVGYEAVLNGDLIALSGFRVRIISECTSLNATLLLLAFVLATPSSWRSRFIGFISGSALIFSVNIIRIAVITIVGRFHPVMFEALHVYLGQIVMFLLVVFVCLFWSRYSGNTGTGNGSLIQLANALSFATIAFPFWLLVNASYIRLMDSWIAAFFAGVLGYRLEIDYQHAVYFQTFNLVVLFALFVSEKRASISLRSISLVFGMAVLILGHILFRVGNVMLTAFDWLWLNKITIGIELIGQYLLPVYLWLKMLSYVKNQSTEDLI